jgi:hypothetical protein
MKCWFIAADPDLRKTFLFCNSEEMTGHLLWRIKPAHLLRLYNDVPRPAEKAFQTTSDAISSCNPSIKRSRTKSVILSFFPGSNGFGYIFG